MEPRNVTEEMGKKMAEELNVIYFDTSALTGQGIKEAFEQLTRDIMKKKGVGEWNNDGGGVALKKEKKMMIVVKYYIMEKSNKLIIVSYI